MPGRQRKHLEITPAEFYSNVVATEEMCIKYLQDKGVLSCENGAICRRIKSDGELVQGTRKRKTKNGISTLPTCRCANCRSYKTVRVVQKDTPNFLIQIISVEIK